MTALGTRSLLLEIDGEEVTAEISKGVITAAGAEADFTTFAVARSGGGRDYQLEMIGVQDPATGSLWDRVWTAAGEEVACLMKPHGNAVATLAQPHYEFTAVISEPDGDFLGGEADASTTARFTFEVKWKLLAKPIKITS